MKRFAVLAATFLAGCGSSDQVAGGGSDQPNKVWAGRVLTDSGTSAAGVKVQSWSGAWSPQYSNSMSTPIDSGISDSNGRWNLHVPDTGSWFVVARSRTYVAIFTSGGTDTVESLQTRATYSGHVQAAPGLTLEAIWLGGSGGAIALNPDGSFTTSTKPGAYRLWARVSWSGGVDTILLKDRFLIAGDNADSDTLIADTGITLLASAESSPLRSALRGVDFPANNTNAAQWFAVTDQSISGTSVVLPNGFPDSVDSAVLVDADGHGRYFSWQFKLGNSIILQSGDSLAAYAAVGLQLSRRDLDWSGVRSLRITVRGSGRIKLQLNTSNGNRMGEDNQFQHGFDLTSNWTTIEVPLADSMRAPTASKADSLKLHWTDVRSSVQELVFYSGTRNTHFELHEVRAIGSKIANW